MISVQEATSIILQNALPVQAEAIPIAVATGRVLLEPLIADRDFPPFDRVTMDGIAIDYSAFANGQRSFPIEGVGAAGAPQLVLAKASNCIEIMTGAILPKQTDTVIRYEDVSITNGQATINADTVKAKQNVHHQATDRNRGVLLVEKGCRLSAAEIAVAATVGKAKLQVASPPKAIILSTGDELVNVTEQPLPHQIRRSNTYSLQAALTDWGLSADTDHLFDEKNHIHDRLEKIIDSYPLIVLSGGVSKGKYDYIPEVLEELKCSKLFHRVAQRPGKPFWFGTTPKGGCIFALPGNPVSTFMCAQRYLIPWLNASVGLPPFTTPIAQLQKPFTFTPALTYFLQVKTNYSDEAIFQAWPVAGRGSGDLANLTLADGFLELPPDQTVFEKGSCFPFHAYRK